MDLDLELMVVV